MLTPFCRVEEIRPSPASEADFSDGVPEAKKEKKKESEISSSKMIRKFLVF